MSFNMSGSDTAKLIVYIGSSMSPTLKPADLLQAEPYKGKKIRPGDVIVFLSPRDERMTVHRVVSISDKGVRTRGDRNSRIDPWRLNPERIIGRVLWAQRGNRRRAIYAGFRGRLFSLALRVIRKIDIKMSCLLRPAYRGLAQTGLFRLWLPASMRFRILSFNRPEGSELQLLIGQRVVGRLLPDAARWNLRRPFRLFVDESRLPR